MKPLRTHLNGEVYTVEIEPGRDKGRVNILIFRSGKLIAGTTLSEQSDTLEAINNMINHLKTDNP